MAWFLRLKRPKHDLTWRSIRRKWAFSKEQANIINGSICNHHRKSPSAPLLSNTFESLTNNVINVDQESFQFINEREKQRSESVVEFSLPSISKIKHAAHHQDLSKVLHSCDIEMIRSELRIIISQLATLSNHTQRQEEFDDESQDWKFIAMVIDRLFLIIFIAIMILFNGFTLYSTPHFSKLQ